MTSYQISYRLYLIVFCFVFRIVSAWLPPIPSGWNHWRIMIPLETLISLAPAVAMFGMQGHFSFSTAPCVPLVERGMLGHTRRYPWFSSAPLNQSAWRQTAACRGRVCPWCTNGLPVRCRLYTSVQWRMFLDVCLWFHATWTATPSIPFHTNTGLVFHGKLLQIQDPTAGQGAGFMRSTFGCGGTEGLFRVRSLWSKPWTCAKRGCRNPGYGVLKLFGGAGMKRPGRRAQRVLNECPVDLHIVPDIVPDIGFDIVSDI